MTAFWWGALFGGFVGAIAGVFVAGFCAAARRGDDAAELAELDRVLAEHRKRVGEALAAARYLEVRALEQARPESLN